MDLQEHYRGTFLPVELIRLYESGGINGEEILLLSKVDALQDPKKGGCWASNQYLAKWWRKTDTWVSKTLSKLQVLKLVEITFPREGERVIKTIFSLNKTSRGVEQNFKGGLNKSSTKVPFGKERVRISKNSAAAPHGRSFPLMGVNGSPAIKLSAPVQAYAKFSRMKEFHIRLKLSPEEIKYARGGEAGGWSRATLITWQKSWEQFIKSQDAPVAEFVLDFYIKHYDYLTHHQNAPMAHTLLSFIERYEWIRRTIRLEQKRREAEGLEDDGEELDEDSSDTHTTPHRSTSNDTEPLNGAAKIVTTKKKLPQMTEEEHSAWMDRIDPPVN